MTVERNDLPMTPTPLEHEAYGWVVRFVSGEAGPAEIKALKEWSARSPAHAEAFDRASKVWKALDPARRKLLAETGPDVGIDAGRRPAIPHQPRLGRRAILGGAMAASVAAATVLVARPPLGLWPSWSELAADYRTGTGEQRQITLGNSVFVDMNTQTSIALRTSGENAGRIELIGGEAMVSAAKTVSPFTVIAADGRIVASRARFNVRYDGQSVCVSCLEGDVQVERLARVLQLSAGRQAIYSAHGIGDPVAIDPMVVTAWTDGVVIFEATPIADVIAEVNRYRREKIILTNAALGHQRLNARFRIENIGRVVNQIEQVFGARARTLPGGITLLG
jgi:transmembrane sensor